MLQFFILFLLPILKLFYIAEGFLLVAIASGDALSGVHLLYSPQLRNWSGEGGDSSCS